MSESKHHRAGRCAVVHGFKIFSDFSAIMIAVRIPCTIVSYLFLRPNGLVSLVSFLTNVTYGWASNQHAALMSTRLEQLLRAVWLVIVGCSNHTTNRTVTRWSNGLTARLGSYIYGGTGLQSAECMSSLAIGRRFRTILGIVGFEESREAQGFADSAVRLVLTCFDLPSCHHGKPQVLLHHGV